MKKIFILSIILLISSCAMVKKQEVVQELDHLNNNLKLDFKSFFSGNLEGMAITQDGDGKITNSFTLKINGQWDENKGTVKYSYLYADSKKDSKTFLVTIGDDGTFEAIGHQIVGAIKGEQKENAARSFYSSEIKDAGVKNILKYVDKMYLIDAKSMIIISSFKGDLKSGTTIISLKKIAD